MTAARTLGPVRTARSGVVPGREVGDLRALGGLLGARLGAADGPTWFRHNPCAEWYANTIRLEGSPAREHHRKVFGAAPYDAFLDDWHAEAFDPDDLVRLFARAGAKYVVPTSKHHDGIALWDAPGTGTRNTVHRGPRRDLVQAFGEATRP